MKAPVAAPPKTGKEESPGKSESTSGGEMSERYKTTDLAIIH